MYCSVGKRLICRVGARVFGKSSTPDGPHVWIGSDSRCNFRCRCLLRYAKTKEQKRDPHVKLAIFPTLKRYGIPREISEKYESLSLGSSRRRRALQTFYVVGNRFARFLIVRDCFSFLLFFFLLALRFLTLKKCYLNE